MNHHGQLEQLLKDLERERNRPRPKLLELMPADQPDTAERTRLAVQAIPFALPKRKDAK